MKLSESMLGLTQLINVAHHNDVQSNAVGFAENNYLYSATRKSLEEIYSAVKKNKIVNIVVISKTIWEFIQNPTLTLII